VNCIVVLPGVYATLVAGIPLTVKSLACRDAGSAGSEMFTVKLVGRVEMTLPSLGTVLVTLKGAAGHVPMHAPETLSV
jgi:hypothetical protein